MYGGGISGVGGLMSGSVAGIPGLSEAIRVVQAPLSA